MSAENHYTLHERYIRTDALGLLSKEPSEWKMYVPPVRSCTDKMARLLKKYRVYAILSIFGKNVTTWACNLLASLAFTYLSEKFIMPKPDYQIHQAPRESHFWRRLYKGAIEIYNNQFKLHRDREKELVYLKTYRASRCSHQPRTDFKDIIIWYQTRQG